MAPSTIASSNAMQGSSAFFFVEKYTCVHWTGGVTSNGVWVFPRGGGGFKSGSDQWSLLICLKTSEAQHLLHWRGLILRWGFTLHRKTLSGIEGLNNMYIHRIPNAGLFLYQLLLLCGGGERRTHSAFWHCFLSRNSGFPGLVFINSQTELGMYI